MPNNGLAGTPYYLNQDLPPGRPGLFAMVVGVSAYPRLPTRDEVFDYETFGMFQLASPALSALQICKWLLENGQSLSPPLAGLWLLLSPSAREIERDAGIAGMAPEATRDAFAQAMYPWREAASGHKENATFFYFAGHGIERSRGDPILLFSDFLAPASSTLSRGVSLYNISSGMAPSPDFPDIARTQFTFIDACRNRPGEFDRHQLMTVPDLWDVAILDNHLEDDRQAPIFLGGIPGSTAYGIRGDQSIFSKALISCFNGDASEAEEENGRLSWRVTDRSLISHLDQVIRPLNERYGTRQDWSPEGSSKYALLRTLPEPPLVEVTVTVEPDDALPLTQIIVEDESDRPPLVLAIDSQPYPYVNYLRAGTYAMRAIVDPPHPEFHDVKRFPPVEPPRFAWKARMDA